MRPSFLITAWLLWFVAHASRMVIPPVLPLIKEELGISHAQAGQIFTYLTLGYCGALLTVPFWSRVPGYRRTLKISLAGLTLTLFLMASPYVQSKKIVEPNTNETVKHQASDLRL